MGFTNVDGDITAETGMSSSSVYRYFRSKEELIDAGADESLARTYASLVELLDAATVPGPAETLATLMNDVLSRQRGDYDLTEISLAAWTEALRRPAMRGFACRFYSKMNDVFTELSRRWISAGVLPTDAEPAALASLFVTLMPGLIVISHLYELPTSDVLVQGSPTSRRRRHRRSLL